MRDAAGHDRMYVAKRGWISVDPEDLSITISDGDGYTLSQTIFITNIEELDEVISYLSAGENPRPGLSRDEEEELADLERQVEDDDGIEISSEVACEREERVGRIKYLKDKAAKAEKE